MGVVVCVVRNVYIVAMTHAKVHVLDIAEADAPMDASVDAKRYARELARV